MGFNNIDTTRRYTKYKRHINDSSERIDAKDVNTIQQNINEHQEDTNIIKDTAFQERVYTIFENNLYANAMFLDVYENGEYIDKTKSFNHVLNANLKNVSLDNLNNTGQITSIIIHSAHGKEIALNDFFLITNEYIPIGASIKYYLRLLTGERYPITPNALKTPLHLSNDITAFSIVAELSKNALNESPTINGYAILYWDSQVEKNYGMTNPDLQRFLELEIGDDDGITVIVRDRANEDKVVQIREPLDTVTLVYNPDNENRLAFTKAVYPNYNEEDVEISQIVKLSYSDYVDSKGNTSNVVTSIEQRTNAKKGGSNNLTIVHPNGESEINYKRLEQEMEELTTNNSKES